MEDNIKKYVIEMGQEAVFWTCVTQDTVILKYGERECFGFIRFRIGTIGGLPFDTIINIWVS